MRVFMAPGVAHCGGGAGPAPTGQLKALLAWVEEGKAPDSLLATRREQTRATRSRPLCAYPLVAKYKGRGSTDDAASFECRADSKFRCGADVVVGRTLSGPPRDASASPAVAGWGQPRRIPDLSAAAASPVRVDIRGLARRGDLHRLAEGTRRWSGRGRRVWRKDCAHDYGTGFSATASTSKRVIQPAATSICAIVDAL